MSTTSLPSYIGPTHNNTPSYSAEPGQNEQRLALTERPGHPTADFVKQTKNGDVTLRLTGQQDDIDRPVYGTGANIEGNVEIAKLEGISLEEVAEGGHFTTNLCLNTVVLWSKESSNGPCPTTMDFSLKLPATFTYDNKTYPLPPSHYVKMSGLPGFTAAIKYSVNATLTKPNLGTTVKSKKLHIAIGAIVVSTGFTYYPRTRPARPIPTSLVPTTDGFQLTPEWRIFESEIEVRHISGENIKTKLYLPATRIFSMTQPIPFHLTYVSTAMSLAAFLPFSPAGSSSSSAKNSITRIELVRQSTADVRNMLTEGVKTDIWKTDTIGQGIFHHTSDGPTWISYSGEINIIDGIKIPGFKAAGLSVQDCILLSMYPPEPRRSSLGELRQVVPIQLATDTWNGSRAVVSNQGNGYNGNGYHDYEEDIKYSI